MSRVGISRIRVLVMTTTLPAQEGDSTPSFVLDLAKEIARQTPADVVVVAPSAPGAPLRQQFGPVEVRRFRYLPRRLETLGSSTDIVPALRAQPLRWLQVPFLLAGLSLVSLRVVWQFRPHVIHSNWVVPIGVLGQLLRHLTPGARPAHLVTSRGADVFAFRGRLFDALRRWVVDTADLVLPVSEELADALGVPRGQAIPMGAPPLFSSYRNMATPDAPVLFVGRLAPSKGADVLMRALALSPATRARIVGGGAERQHLKKLAEELGVSDRVEFLGPQPKERVAEELSQASALVLPSIVGADGAHEGSPNVLMEAVLVGTPIIASRIGGVPARFEHGRTALLFAPGDHRELAAMLDQLAREPHRARQRALTASDILGRDATSAGVGEKYASAIRRMVPPTVLSSPQDQ
jgi:colanic acid/amylovoran biosynthesis glycosyltransferase